MSTTTFTSKEGLAHHILDRCLEHSLNSTERKIAVFYSVAKANELWDKYTDKEI